VVALRKGGEAGFEAVGVASLGADGVAEGGSATSREGRELCTLASAARTIASTASWIAASP
jgi:hypothetical protein